MTIDEATFESLAAATLERFAERIEEAADELDVELQEGVLTVETAQGATYLLNKHAPLKQIWLSSPISGAAHFAYDDTSGAWNSTRGGEPLVTILERELSDAAGTGIGLGEVAA